MLLRGVPVRQTVELPQGFALAWTGAFKSGRGLPQSKTQALMHDD
jgi:hypothetical protein